MLSRKLFIEIDLIYLFTNFISLALVEECLHKVLNPIQNPKYVNSAVEIKIDTNSPKILTSRVGKLPENRLKIGQDEQEEEERAGNAQARVGKLSEDRLKIGQDNLADDTEADMINRVGKLSVDR